MFSGIYNAVNICSCEMFDADYNQFTINVIIRELKFTNFPRILVIFQKRNELSICVYTIKIHKTNQ